MIANTQYFQHRLLMSCFFTLKILAFFSIYRMYYYLLTPFDVCNYPLQLKDLDKSNATADSWAAYKWIWNGQKNTSRLYTFIPSPGPSPPRMTLPKPYWVRLNRLRIGVGLFRSTMNKWGTTLQMGHLVWRLSMMTLWTGFKQQNCTSDNKICPNEEVCNYSVEKFIEF